MGLGRVFMKIGKGVLKVGKIFVRVGDVPYAKDLVAIVPVVGPGLSIALKWVDKAERIYSNIPKSGKQKMAWAVQEALVELRAAGLDEKRVLGLLEVALLVYKGEAMLAEATK